MNPYVWLAFGGTVIAVAFGGFFYGGHVTSLKYESALARQSADANATLATETAKSAAADSRYAEIANKLDAEHAKYLQDLESTRGDFHQQLVDGVRDAERRARGRCPAAAEATHPSVGANSAAGSEPGFQGIDVAGLERITDGAMRLAEYARVCHAWAAEVGR